MKVYYIDSNNNFSGEGSSSTCPLGATTVVPSSANHSLWNGIEWVLQPAPSFTVLQAIKKSEILQGHKADCSALTVDIAIYETASFTKQETEARKWLADNTEATPFIDSLLTSRNNGETKLELCNKIILKADAYTPAYASLLGKFHRLNKAVDDCTTVAELDIIVW